MQHFLDTIQSLIPERFRNDRGATTMEWCLLLTMLVIPAWVIIRGGLLTLAGHYGLVTTLNQMPFP